MRKFNLILLLIMFISIQSDQNYFTYGVIDRIVGGVAVVLLEGQQPLQLGLNVMDLPANSEEGSIVKIGDVAGKMTVIKIDDEKTNIEKKKVKVLMNKLKDK